MGTEMTLPLCPLCHGSARALVQLAHTTVWRCTAAACTLRFAVPQFDDTQLADFYRQLYYPDHPVLPDPRVRGKRLPPTTPETIRAAFQRMVARRGPLAGQRLLDYGSGEGTVGEVAEEFGLRVTGIESNHAAATASRSRNAAKVYHNLDDLRAAEPEAAFEWITLWNVVEHLRQPWLDLAALRTLLAPGGRIVITTPNFASLRARLQPHKWLQWRNPTHFYYFTPRSLAALLARSGWSDIREQRVTSRYPYHNAARAAAQRLLVYLRLGGEIEFSATCAAGAQQPTKTARPAELIS